MKNVGSSILARFFERTGIDSAGKVTGRFKTTGIRPRFAERLKQYGMELPVFF